MMQVGRNITRIKQLVQKFLQTRDHRYGGLFPAHPQGSQASPRRTQVSPGPQLAVAGAEENVLNTQEKGGGESEAVRETR